jgi:hypothetical protein
MSVFMNGRGRVGLGVEVRNDEPGNAVMICNPLSDLSSICQPFLNLELTEIGSVQPGRGGCCRRGFAPMLFYFRTRKNDLYLVSSCCIIATR